MIDSRADIALLIGCSMSLNTEAGGFAVDRGEIRGETFFLSMGLILSWFNILKYFEWNTKVCVCVFLSFFLFLSLSFFFSLSVFLTHFLVLHADSCDACVADENGVLLLL
jgi:hypothetical protein